MRVIFNVAPTLLVSVAVGISMVTVLFTLDEGATFTAAGHRESVQSMTTELGRQCQPTQWRWPLGANTDKFHSSSSFPNTSSLD
jgi:hypothetical protein